MEDQTEVIELEGVPLDPEREARRQKRIKARANYLYMYLCLFEGQDRLFTQAELSEELALGKSQQLLKEAVEELEGRGWLRVNRNMKPHRYELLKTDTKETA